MLNPNSGAKLDKNSKIEDYFTQNKIPFEIFATEKAGDSFRIPLNMDLANYSALIACGGDGTTYEVINGMMARDDQVRVPIGIIPNGTGNVNPSGLGIRDTEMALNAILKRTVAKFDLERILIDTENDSDIPKGELGFTSGRRVYSFCMFGMGTICQIC